MRCAVRSRSFLNLISILVARTHGRQKMSRARQRICLQAGLHLNLNELAQYGLVRRGERTDTRIIRWVHPDRGEVASGKVSADMVRPSGGWLDIQLEESAQRITLRCEPRHFGGVQWYIVCPALGLAVSVIWKPEGATEFRCRQAWGSQVAYLSQFGKLHRQGSSR